MSAPRPAHSQLLRLGLGLLACLLLGACRTAARPALPSPSAPSTVLAASSGWLQIYFTDPQGPIARIDTGGPDARLADAIHQARLSIDMAAYSLNLWSIRDALINAHQRGVVVRLVMESDNADSSEVQDLAAAGIPVVSDQRQGLMHDNFVVLDRSEVWTGSMNFTVSGAYQDNNDLIRIDSAQVAADYTTRFEDMFTSDRFGPDAVGDTPYPALTVDGDYLEVLFSPADGVARRLIDLINSTQQSIDFLAYTFTSNDIGNAMLRRAKSGVTVRGIMDASQVKASQGTEYDPFLLAGLDVRLDGNTHGLMHHAVFIIDRRIVITGSYDFTLSAESANDENVIIFYDPGIAAAYLGEFEQLYNLAQPKSKSPFVQGN